MKPTQRVATTATLTALLCSISLLAPSPAKALPYLDWSVGKTRRAVLYEHHDGGATITVWGSGPCTASTSDRETVMRSMSQYGDLFADWNDSISTANDYSSCDIDLWEDENLQGNHSGYINYGEGEDPVYVGAAWNDQASSFSIS